MSKEKKLCPECGTSNKEESKYCSQCGYSFKKKGGANKAMLFVLSLIVLGVGGFAYVYFTQSEESNQVQTEEVAVSGAEDSKEVIDVDSEEETEEVEEEIEEVFTHWELPEGMIGEHNHALTVSFSNTNKVEAEIKYGSITQGQYRYFLTVKEDEEASNDYEKHYQIDEVEKVEYALSNGDYPFLKDEINEYLESEGFDYEIKRVDQLVRYIIYEPDLERLEIGSLPDHQYKYIVQQIDYAADVNDSYDDYLIFMEEYQLFPAE